jgi:glycosyltransferase involved in cell wall biosynthesis
MAGPSLSTFDQYLATAGNNCSKLLNLPPFVDSEKRDFLASATVIAQPSRVESLGLVLIEAWANRKPVLAANIDVSRELIAASGGGVNVPFGDAHQLATEIERMLADPKLRESMGEGGHRLALEYSGDACWRRSTGELERVATAEAGRSR